MDLSSLSRQAHWRSSINNRPNAIRSKTGTPRGAIIKDRRLQQPFTAHLLNEIRTLA